MPLQIPHPNTPLRLYRHLLRESTYLPALCRPWITSQIQRRFRDCRNKNPTPYVKKAHSSLRYLRSANTGHIGRLEHLCFMATGRVGKRRRILATSQLTSHPSNDTAELGQKLSLFVENVIAESPPPNRFLAPASAASSTATPAVPWHKSDWLDNWSVDKVSAVARSQVAQQNSNWPQNMRRVIGTNHITEGRNCLGKPFRPKLARNKFKKHWAAVLRQILPPLPQGEWDHLASLVDGEASTDELKLPPRRPVARFIEDNTLDSASGQWDWFQHVLKPARMIERGGSRQLKSLTGKEDQDPRGHGRPIGVRVISPRRLQRMYGRVWEMSPIIKPSSTKNKKQNWSIAWGKSEQKITAPSPRDLLFFQGVGRDGKVLPKAEKSSKG